MSRKAASFPLALLAAAALLASCGPGPFQPDLEKTNYAASLGVDIANSTRTESGLYYRDIVIGGGALVPDDTGTSVTVRYTGWLRNGVQFDTGTLGPVVIGLNNLVVGFDEGIRGMRVGGRRQLIIPPALGYGSQGSGSSIPPNAILVFVVELLSINPRT